MKNIKYIFTSMLCITLLFSCDNAIDIDPRDEIVESNALNSVRDIQDAAIGVYGGISGSNLIGWNSRFTDNTRKGVGNRGQGVQVHTWSINSSTVEPAGLWNNLYGVINRLNRVLAVIDNIPTKNAAEVLTINRIKAELLVIRAMNHFDLMRLYSPSFTNTSDLAVPYIDFPVVLEKPVRNTVAEVYTGIDKDLDAASALFGNSTNTKFYVTKDVISALKARVSLYKGNDNINAINNASTLISKYPLVNINSFPDVWTDASDTGVIFQLSRNPGEGAAGTLFTDNNGDIFFSPSDELVSLYSALDIRRFVYFNSNLQEVDKYPGTTANPGLNNIKMFRVAEQYLIRAESYAKEKDLVKAAADYNMLRRNRINNYVDETFTTELDALAKISEERRRELAFEGHRFFDLKRKVTFLLDTPKLNQK